jgi:cell division protein ZapA
METQDTKNITVVIAGRPYPLKIKESDEPVIRKIVNEINDKLNRFQLTYSSKDKQDCLSMALLTYAVDLHKMQQTTPADEDSTVAEKLSQIDTLLDKLL